MYVLLRLWFIQPGIGAYVFLRIESTFESNHIAAPLECVSMYAIQDSRHFLTSNHVRFLSLEEKNSLFVPLAELV